MDLENLRLFFLIVAAAVICVGFVGLLGIALVIEAAERGDEEEGE
jgi:predicted cation transporter